jgi:phospholipid transport system substrate-binding protein
MIRRKLPLLTLLTLFTLLLVGSVSQAASAPGPLDQLKVTVNKVLSILRDSSLSKEQKRTQVKDLVYDRFNFRAMSQGVLGVNWRRATPQQRDRFIKLFSELLEETYSGRIDAYSGETVRFAGQRIIDDHRAEVDTYVNHENKDVPIKYKLVKDGEKWLVYDVRIEGVSLVLNYRNTYADIVEKKGIDGLLKQMTEKVGELKSDGGGPEKDQKGQAQEAGGRKSP